jgi:hypothetical protein
MNQSPTAARHEDATASALEMTQAASSLLGGLVLFVVVLLVVVIPAIRGGPI